MHYKGHIITKKIPTKKEIEKILIKYKEGRKSSEKLDFKWDWYQVGGRYGGKINIHFNLIENEDKNFLFHTRNYKYFIIDILEKIKSRNQYYEELEYLQYMGLNDNILHVDGGYYNDTIDFDITNCFAVIDPDGNLYRRELWDKEQQEWLVNSDFDEEVKMIDLKDKFITIIDFHY